MILCLVGRQAKLAFAELESLHGPKLVQPLSDTAALVDADVSLKRLGGTIKTAAVLATLDTSEFDEVMMQIKKLLPEVIKVLPDGKIKLGLSLYGFSVNIQKLNEKGLNLKKTVKNLGRSVRIVPNLAMELSSAQVLHNQLTSPVGVELVLVRSGRQTIVAKTLEVQNIEDYALRDRGRPKRDAFVGMLPPKLAQIIINLGTRKWEMGNGVTANSKNQELRTKNLRLLDPFCGTGVLLQEALLMGYNVYGTDIDKRMISYAQANIEWLESLPYFPFPGTQALLKVADATSAKWQQPIDAVVSETYLGLPLSGLPKPQKLQEIINGCDQLHQKFFARLASQLSPGTPLCIAVPAWKVPDGFMHLPMLDDLSDFGYNRIDFKHATRTDLIYHRPDQIVARELLVLTRK